MWSTSKVICGLGIVWRRDFLRVVSWSDNVRYLVHHTVGTAFVKCVVSCWIYVDGVTDIDVQNIACRRREVLCS